MIHVLIAVGITGIIIGITITLVAIAFMMGALPDSPKKRQEDWLGLQETMRERQPLGGRKKRYEKN